MSRLFEQYNSEIKKSMQEKFQYGNVMEIPKLEKIVINIGVGDAVGNMANDMTGNNTTNNNGTTNGNTTTTP